jgi:hypothetical protein
MIWVGRQAGIEELKVRHARPYAGHPRLSSFSVAASKTWMAGTSPAMTAYF